MLRRAIILLMSCALVVISSAAWATIVKSFTLRGLATAAHEVVRGEVIDEEVVYDAWWGRVYTHTTVRVDEAIGGTARAGDLIQVRQLGGILDGIETILVGTSDFTLGDEVVLFTRSDGAFHYLVGMSQGRYSVLRNEDGQASVTRGIGNLGLVAQPQPSERLAPNRASLEDFLEAVTLMRTPGGTP